MYDFIKKYKEAGAQRFFNMVGSYKTIKYEILETTYHECEHVIQDDYTPVDTYKLTELDDLSGDTTIIIEDSEDDIIL